MAVELDKEELWFPNPVQCAVDDRPFAYGGDLSVDRIDLGYAVGAFPFFPYSPDAVIEWWCPRKRFVIFPEEIHISHSMLQLLKSQKYNVTFNHDFDGVIEGCSKVNGRDNENNCWLKGEILEAYKRYHREGHGMSVEVWEGDRLVGGLYGGLVGNCFNGESMFSLVPSASKLALIVLAKLLEPTGGIIDCHFETKHLWSMGGRFMMFEDFWRILRHKFTSELGKDRIEERKSLMLCEQMLNKARNYPVCKCCRIQIEDDDHTCTLIIARKIEKNKFVACAYRLDLWLEGLTNCDVYVVKTIEELDEIVTYYSQYEFADPKDIDYSEAHALIYKAREWGRKAGFDEDKKFFLGRLVLDEHCPDADAMMDSIQMGRNGKHCVMAHRRFVEKKREEADKIIGKGKYEILIVEDYLELEDIEKKHSSEDSKEKVDDLPF